MDFEQRLRKAIERGEHSRSARGQEELKKALTERALNAENHHLASSEIAGTTRNGYGRKVK